MSDSHGQVYFELWQQWVKGSPHMYADTSYLKGEPEKVHIKRIQDWIEANKVDLEYSKFFVKKVHFVSMDVDLFGQSEEEMPPAQAGELAAMRLGEIKAAKKALNNLLRFKPNEEPKGFRSEYFSEGDQDAPFFSEAYLYNLLGKEDARTLLAYVGMLQKTIGLGGVDVEV